MSTTWIMFPVHVRLLGPTSSIPRIRCDELQNTALSHSNSSSILLKGVNVVGLKQTNKKKKKKKKDSAEFIDKR